MKELYHFKDQLKCNLETPLIVLSWFSSLKLHKTSHSQVKYWQQNDIVLLTCFLKSVTPLLNKSYPGKAFCRFGAHRLKFYCIVSNFRTIAFDNAENNTQCSTRHFLRCICMPSPCTRPLMHRHLKYTDL